MKITEVKSARTTFKGVHDSKFTDSIYKIVLEFNLKDEAPTTRQISNVYNKVQTIQEAITSTDKDTLPTNVQDSILQSVLNPLLAQKKLKAVFGEGNQKCWLVQDEILNKAKVQSKQ